jgi:hypothetical protein
MIASALVSSILLQGFHLLCQSRTKRFIEGIVVSKQNRPLASKYLQLE